MLDVCLLGTGGMMPLPYRWLTSLMTRCDGSNLLIDCGEGTQVALKEKGWSPKPVDVICFTHYHADHISGLPGLLLTMGNAERTEPVIMIGPKGLERVVGALRTIAPELPFPLRFIELSEPRAQFQIGPYVIDAYKVNHNVTCYGYSISIPRKGRFDVERAGNKALRRMREGLYSRGAASLLFRSLQGRGQPPPEPGAYAEKTGEKHGAVLRLGLVKPCVSGLSAPGLSGLNINLRLTPVLWGKS